MHTALEWERRELPRQHGRQPRVLFPWGGRHFDEDEGAVVAGAAPLPSSRSVTEHCGWQRVRTYVQRYARCGRAASIVQDLADLPEARARYLSLT